ncbi:TetR/AcrR family transcriptional regulator [Streptomyces sp. NPDC001537]
MTETRKGQTVQDAAPETTDVKRTAATGGKKRAAETPRPRKRAPGAGRPRDPKIQERIMHAARVVYGTKGWAAFHFDAVAKEAGVSRDALYRRFESREALLIEALSSGGVPAYVPGPGDLRTRLLRLAKEVYRYFRSPEGLADLRVHLEAEIQPGIHRSYQEIVVRPGIAQVENALRSSIDKGDLPTDAPVAHTVRAIYGGVLLQALLTAGGSSVEEQDTDGILEGLVDLTLRGAGYKPSA